MELYLDLFDFSEWSWKKFLIRNVDIKLDGFPSPHPALPRPLGQVLSGPLLDLRHHGLALEVVEDDPHDSLPAYDVLCVVPAEDSLVTRDEHDTDGGT